MFKFNENNEVTDQNTCRAVLVGVSFGEDMSASMEELEGLAEAAGVEVLGHMLQARERPDTATYIGKGKVEELAEMCGNMQADTVIFNNELSGMQIRNLEDATGVTVLDRTILILDIFADRAVSSVGKLQVEYAQLKYRLPRLLGFGRALSRTGGGIGTRGPGEKKLETDRRHIQSRMDEIKREIREAQKSRDVQRSRREKSEIPVVSLVGYTNAGKSAVMNALLRENDKEDKSVFEKDMLFATLDISQRKIKLDSNHEFILADTVGFVSKLPHSLVEAFKSTLEEVTYSDLLLHIVDASAEDREFKMNVTHSVLKEIGAGDIPCVTVFNKIDNLSEAEISEMGLAEGESMMISARYGTNMPLLTEIIRKNVFADLKRAALLIPYEKGSVTSYLMEKCSVSRVEYTGTGTYIEAELEEADYNRLAEYFIKDFESVN